MNEEKHILFGQYLANELSVVEKDNFEKELIHNKDLASEFEIFKGLTIYFDNKFANETESEAFKQNLKLIMKKNLKPNKSKVVTFGYWKYAIAASVVLLMGLFLFQNTDPTFEEYYNPEKAYFTERGNLDESLKRAQDAFNEGKYKESIPFFEAVLSEKKLPEIQCFYAISLLESNQIQKAEANLNEIKAGNSIYKYKATWFLALSKLKQKEYKSCKDILLTIPDNFEDYEQVKDLLSKLD